MPQIGLIESCLRQGQQTLLSSRLRTRHITALAEQLEGSGLAGLDVFGGATFGVSLTNLAEDPFERLAAVRAATTLPLYGLIRGQSLVGNRPLPDDVVDRFVATVAELGLDVFRCFDPLNDVRNLARVVEAVRRSGKHAEAALVYTESPAHSAEGYIRLGVALVEMGFQSLSLFDPAGLLGAGGARAIVSGLVQETGLPVSVHCATITGQASFAYLAAAEAGASALDVCLSPLAGGASLPGTEGVLAALRGTELEPAVDPARVLAAADALDSWMPLYELVSDPSGWQLDSGTLRTRLAPSVQQHLRWECEAQGVGQRQPEVVEEIARVGADMGHPPLISPVAEIVVSQAVANVASGDRYLIISQEVKDYFLGLFGAPPGPLDPEIQRLVIGNEEPITVRSGDVLEPTLEETGRLMTRHGLGKPTNEQLLEFVLFPEAAAAAIKGESRRERLADEPEVVEDEEEPAAPALVDGGDLSEPIGDAAAILMEVPAPAAKPAEPAEDELPAREFSVEVDGETFEVRVVALDGGFAAVAGTPRSDSAAPAAGAGGSVKAPMQGLIAKLPVKVGDRVEVGQTVAILEAMKMQNDIPTEIAGLVISVNVAEGQVVSRGDSLLTIG
jgi:pyruvate carboxylase subunit B